MKNNDSLYKDFKLYMRDKGFSSLKTESFMKNSLTPVVMEERNLNVTPMDIYSRLLYDRIIYFGDEVNNDTCNLVNAQLLYLDSVDKRDISIYINSPGGSIIDGLSTIDVINFIESDVSTTCVGMAASMGAVLLSCGKKGKRNGLPHSRIMLHEASAGFRGKTSNIEVDYEQLKRCQSDIYRILSANLGKTYDEIENLCKGTDKWYIGQEGIELGIIDKILSKNE